MTKCQGEANIPLLQLFRAGGGVFCVLELDDHGAAFEAAAGLNFSRNYRWSRIIPVQFFLRKIGHYPAGNNA